MIYKRILAVITVILMLVAIVLMKKKAKQMPVKYQVKEVKK